MRPTIVAVARLVQDGEVARTIAARGVDHLRVRRRRPSSRADGVAAGARSSPDLAREAPVWCPRSSPPDAVDAADVATRAPAGRHGALELTAGFGHAVADRDLVHLHPLHHAAHDLDGHGAPAMRRCAACPGRSGRTPDGQLGDDIWARLEGVHPSACTFPGSEGVEALAGIDHRRCQCVSAAEVADDHAKQGYSGTGMQDLSRSSAQGAGR